MKKYILIVVLVIVVAVVIGYIYCRQLPIINQVGNNEENVVSVKITVHNMNDNEYLLVNPQSILGANYIFPDFKTGDVTVLQNVDPTLLSMGDNCIATVDAKLQISNPFLSKTHHTLAGKPVADVHVIEVVSHGDTVKSCK